MDAERVNFAKSIERKIEETKDGLGATTALTSLDLVNLELSSIFEQVDITWHVLVLIFSQPPPPGYAPNAAQVMASQGQAVNVQQRQAGWFSGGNGGGYTFW